MAERTNPTFRDELGKRVRSAWLDGYLRLPGASERFLEWEQLPVSEREPYCQAGEAVWHYAIDRYRSTIAELETHLSSLAIEEHDRRLAPVSANGPYA